MSLFREVLYKQYTYVKGRGIRRKKYRTNSEPWAAAAPHGPSSGTAVGLLFSALDGESEIPYT